MREITVEAIPERQPGGVGMIRGWKGFQEACVDYRESTEVWDNTLYSLCKKYPKHNDPGPVFAKLGLIGRSYATGLERHTKGKKRRIGIIANFVLKNSASIDKEIHRLSKLKPFLSPEYILTITTSHSNICRLMLPIMSNGRWPRSFVSKYLHFHAPVVPIYDSIGGSLLRSRNWYKWDSEKSTIIAPDNVDLQYWRHCVRLLFLQEDLRAAGYNPTVRELDYYLFWEAN